MPANFESGFAVRDPSWHGQETLLDDYPDSWDIAREHAGLTWDPVESPLYVKVGGDTPLGDGTAEEHFRELKGHKAILRNDNGAELATVRDTYGLVTHGEMGEILEAVLDQDTKLKYETAGSVQGGRKVYTIVRLDNPFRVPGDPSATFTYLVFLNAHDGEGALKVSYSNVRVVCYNTFRMAEAEGARHGYEFSFRHTKTIKDRIKQAQAALSGALKEQQAWLEFASELSLLSITPTQRELFVVEFIPSPPDALISDRVANNIEEARNSLRKILQHDVTTEGIRDTAYGLVQGAGEYLDHYRRYRNRDTYVNRTLLRPEPLKAKAVKLAREVALAS